MDFILSEVSSTGFSVKMDRPLDAAWVMRGSCVGVGVEMMMPCSGFEECCLIASASDG
jgi:hypothetical protein